jgi:SpoVK/Ycf46/Vps4 family AAA+-type ATPase
MDELSNLIAFANKKKTEIKHSIEKVTSESTEEQILHHLTDALQNCALTEEEFEKLPPKHSISMEKLDLYKELEKTLRDIKKCKTDCMTALATKFNVDIFEKTPTEKEIEPTLCKKTTKAPLEFHSSDDRKLAQHIEPVLKADKRNVPLSSIVGLQLAKTALWDAIELPKKMPTLFKPHGTLDPWKGILLFGPPGTGKTMLAKAVASEYDSAFFNVSPSTLMSKWLGDSEKLAKILFQKARHHAPSVIFIDEVDGLCTQRGQGKESECSRKIKDELLTQMQGVENESDGVLVLAATNHPWDLDDAMRRRFSKRVYIPLPDDEAIEQLLRKGLGKHIQEEFSLTEIVGQLKGYSGSDVDVVCSSAIIDKLKEVCKTLENPTPEDIKIDTIDVKEAIKKNKKSVTEKQVIDYEKWMEAFGNK